MLYDVANDGALSRPAEDRKGWRHGEMVIKPAVQQKTGDDDGGGGGDGDDDDGALFAY